MKKLLLLIVLLACNKDESKEAIYHQTWEVTLGEKTLDRSYETWYKDSIVSIETPDTNAYPIKGRNYLQRVSLDSSFWWGFKQQIY